MNQDLNFGNIQQIQDTSFAPIPAGDYLMQASKIELKDTKAGDGKFVNVKFVVVDGPLENRVVFNRFNVQNRNPQAVEIGLGQIKQWLIACGEPEQGDLTLSRIVGMEGKKFIGTVKIKDGDNELKQFKPVPQNYYSQPAAAPQAQPQNQQSNNVSVGSGDVPAFLQNQAN